MPNDKLIERLKLLYKGFRDAKESKLNNVDLLLYTNLLKLAALIQSLEETKKKGN